MRWLLLLVVVPYLVPILPTGMFAWDPPEPIVEPLLVAAPPPFLSLTAQPAEVQPGSAVRAAIALHADEQALQVEQVDIRADDLEIVAAWSASGVCQSAGGGLACAVWAGDGQPAAIFVTTLALPSCDGRARLTATSDGSRAAQIVEIGGPRRCVLWLPLMAND